MHEVDELLERARARVAWSWACSGVKLRVDVEDAPEVLEPAARVPERVALEVEEEVARRRIGQQREAALRLRLEQDVAVASGLARRELELGLLADARERVRRKAGRRLLGGARPSAASVAIPAAASLSICERRMPATRERWSTASQRASQSGRKSQISQCAHGHGSVAGGSATKRSSRPRTRR